MKKVLIVITGIIGSGKSVVCKTIKELGFCVISADEIYHNILKEKGDCFKELVLSFGEGILSNDEINRQKLSKIVFNDKEKLNLLNSITHKFIMKKIIKLADESKQSTVFVEIPLADTAFISKFDKVIVVKTDEKQLIERIKQRDCRSEEQIRSILDIQLENQNFRIDYEIINNSSIEDLKSNVENLINFLKENK